MKIDINKLKIVPKNNLKPNILFDELVEHCKDVNFLYTKYHIKDNEDNKKMFESKLQDIVLTCYKLGLFIINKV